MAETTKAAALGPYFQQLLNDQDVHESVLRAVRAGRGAYGRARGQSAAQAAQDKKLQRRLRETVDAVRDLWGALAEPETQRLRGRHKALGLVVAGGGVFLALNADARAWVMAHLGAGASVFNDQA